MHIQTNNIKKKKRKTKENTVSRSENKKLERKV